MNTARPALWTGPGVQQGELSNVELANQRLLAEARLVLVCAAMSMALLGSGSVNRAGIFVALALYAGISLNDLVRRKAGAKDRYPLNHWADLACYMPVVALSGGLGSDFIIFLLFPVFTACVRGGVRKSVVVAVVSTVIMAGMATLASHLSLGPVIADLAFAPLAPLALILVVGVVIARWAHT